MHGQYRAIGLRHAECHASDSIVLLVCVMQNVMHGQYRAIGLRHAECHASDSIVLLVCVMQNVMHGQYRAIGLRHAERHARTISCYWFTSSTCKQVWCAGVLRM
jgi:folate-dependent tRNA-U54 methylase TrmFO/GidA